MLGSSHKKKLHRHICAQKHTPSTSLSNEVPRCLVLCFPEATLIKHKHSRPALGGSTGAGETLCASKCFTKKNMNLLWLILLCKGAILESIASHLQAQEIWMWYEQTGPGNDSRADLKRTCSFLNSVVSLHLPSIRDRLDLCNVIQGTTSSSNSNQFFFKGSEFTKLNCHPDFQLCCFLSSLFVWKVAPCSQRAVPAYPFQAPADPVSIAFQRSLVSWINTTSHLELNFLQTL